MIREDGKPLKALILCAGYGSRLKPLTDVVPKPLVTVFNVPLVDAAIHRCVQAGAKNIAINTHHLADKMAGHVQSRFAALGAESLFISEESPEILGTGGALSALRNWWNDSSLLVYNGDILSNMRLDFLVARHRTSEAFVTMAVTKKPPGNGGRSVWVDKEGVIKAIAKPTDLSKDLDPQQLKECGFACAYIAEPGLFSYLPHPPKFHDIIESFQAAIKNGKKFLAFHHDGFWADVGTHESLWETNLQVAGLQTSELLDLFGSIQTERLPKKAKNATVDDLSVVSPNSHIGSGANISLSVVLAGGEVSAGESVVNSLKATGFSKNLK